MHIDIYVCFLCIYAYNRKVFKVVFILSFNMKRKVVKHGPSTLIVSLPVKWTKNNGINPGDELEVDQIGKKLIISTESTPESRTTEIDITKMDRTSIVLQIRDLIKYTSSDRPHQPHLIKQTSSLDIPHLTDLIKHTSSDRPHQTDLIKQTSSDIPHQTDLTS